MGRANETEIEIDGNTSKVLIYSGATIWMISNGYCDEQGYEIQPLDRLVPIEGSGGAVEVRMCILGISTFNQDVVILISHTTTHYHRRVINTGR